MISEWARRLSHLQGLTDMLSLRTSARALVVHVNGLVGAVGRTSSKRVSDYLESEVSDLYRLNGLTYRFMNSPDNSMV